MSEPTGTAVAPRRESLSASTRAAAVVAGLSWAANLPAATAIAVAKWCERHDIDPVNELDVLGNKPIPNGRYWQRQIAKAANSGHIESVEEILVHHDPRLEALAKDGGAEAEWAVGELAARKRLRILHGVPEEATGAAVVVVKIKGMEAPLKGCQWAGGGTGRKIGSGGVIKRGAEADPIGEAFPVESAITRAYGKVGRVACARNPAVYEQVRAVDLEAETLAVQIQQDAQKFGEQVKEAGMVGRHALKSGAPYGDDLKTDQEIAGGGHAES